MNRKDKNMNIESGPSPEAMAEFKAPPEGFEVMTPPTIPEGGKEYKSESPEPKGDNVFKHEIKDNNGNIIYKRESSGTEKPGEPGSDWQQFIKYDEQGRKLEVISQKPMPGKESQTKQQFSYDDKTDREIMHGFSEAGVDQGHEWKTDKHTIKDFGDGRMIVEEVTEILEQGGNQDKAEKGSKFIKTMYLDGAKWLGETVLHQGGKKDGQTTQQLPRGIEELPDWK